MKYVICERVLKNKKPPISSPKHILIFSDHISHVEAVPKGMKAISAGDVRIKPTVHCSGHSVSLNITPKNHERDTRLIDVWLVYGESMSILASMDYDCS